MVLEKSNGNIFKKWKIPNFWPLLAQIWAKTDFPQKLGYLTF